MRNITLAGVSLLCLSTNSWAEIDPQDIHIGVFRFTPTLELRESYNDNYRGLSTNEQESWITGISPTFLLSTGNRNSEYELQYNADNQTYHSDSEVSHTDHHVRLRSIMELTSRHRLSWGLEYHRVEETSDTESITENDKYSQAIARASYRYGAPTARNQLEFGTHYEQRRYHNSGDLNASEERDSLMFNSIWYHRLGGGVRSLLELRHTDHDYKQASARRDSTNVAVLGGAIWDATAKTSGNVRLGAERKDFDSDTRKDFTSPMWEVGVTWKPRTYSVFNLNTRRAFDEGDDGASTINDWTTEATWDHEWTSRIATELKYRYSEREYEGIDRDDDRTSYGVGVTYSPDRWIDVGLSYLRTENDSTLDWRTFDRNIYMLSLELSL
ncbi:outer membrane beta-barrel protein [Stutzerimonas nitrititolerans]|uniref:outer membrane beta-barrel protein n=1 Tax=Stutzerimonas nitrititolerans TaxID=2482751 RepID=UPI002898350B|nr:outer membrane beta-barrel protein [Stutzerimonas nitrititolerans]